MGTSDAYTGSGGRSWGETRRAVDGLSDGDQAEALADLLAAAASATPWYADVPQDSGTDGMDDLQSDGTPPRVALPTMLRIPKRWGSGSGGTGSAGGVAVGGTAAGGGLSERSGRSRRQASRVGARAVCAGVAYANRDAAALAALGLDLAELDRLDPIERCRRIMDLFD